jgi:hypothetical protein
MKKLYTPLIILLSATSALMSVTDAERLRRINTDITTSKFASSQRPLTLLSYFESTAQNEEAKKSKNLVLSWMAKNSVILLPDDLEIWRQILNDTSTFIEGDSGTNKDFVALNTATNELFNALKIMRRSYGITIEKSLEKIGKVIEKVAAAGKKLKGSLFSRLKSKVKGKSNNKDEEELLKRIKDKLSARIKQLVESYNKCVASEAVNDGTKAKKVSY